ncbi:uncharacterized protein RMCC_4466 [Mycolicibacterium canariasense]|uniref:Uncharacterized protein n=1 Tax=Mycolicibacterium canariasense TaxID=228230 RepID=A0A117IB74_MYCCR|nr:uncharacterized protein RMCC_4466 [Mycolicibacterium canariasense]
MGVLTPMLICDMYRMRSQTTGARFRLSDTSGPGGRGVPGRQTIEWCGIGMPTSSAPEPADVRKPNTDHGH